MNNNEITVFESFRFKIGDIVLRLTDSENDRGIIVARALREFVGGASRTYTVAFDSLVANKEFEEIELRGYERPVRM